MEPLLKWTGGKRALLKYIKPLLPDKYNTYIEPFIGGGALFFDICPPDAIIGDKNEDLIECYIEVRDNTENVIEELLKLENSSDEYYKIRQGKPDTSVKRSARMLYLTTYSFNGIYRVNLNGDFNVPYNHKKNSLDALAERIRSASKILKGKSLLSGDFADILKDASQGDFVYLDPPYTVAHNNNNFIKYNQHIFSWKDQERLVEFANDLIKKECIVVISNADHESIDKLYKDYKKITINRSSVIAASSHKRAKITESIFIKES